MTSGQNTSRSGGNRAVGAIAGVLVAAMAVAVVLTRDEPGESTADDDGRLRTVFVGDSITRGVSPETRKADPDYSWVTYAVEDARSPWWLDANVAVFGQTLQEMEASFDTEVVDRDPDAVVILGGTNDALRGLTPQDSALALRQMIEAAQEAGAEVWVVSPPPLDPGYGVQVGPTLVAEALVAEDLGVPFVDLTAALSEDGTWRPGLTSDGVHPSLEGARVIADTVLDQVGE